MKRALGFMNKGGTPITQNTFLGGVSATISTAALLATKLGISVANITNFEVVGSDIKCFITGSYGIPFECFQYDTTITYYIDSDNLVTNLGTSSFGATTNIKKLSFKGIVSQTGTNVIGGSNIEVVELLNATSIAVGCLNGSLLKIAYIPKATNIGTPSVDSQFSNTNTTVVYANPSLATNNSGGIDASLTATLNVFVTDFTAPTTPIISATINDTSFKISDSASASTNYVEYYELYKNDVFVKKITNGHYLSGLTASTAYNGYTVIAVDKFYNKSLISNTLNVTTNTTANALLTGLVSHYKLDEETGWVAYDNFKNDNLTNIGITQNQTGKVGKSYLSTVTNTKLHNITATVITGNFTVNMWVYRTANSQDNGGLFDQGSYNTNSGFGIWMNSSNQMRWRINQTLGAFVSASNLPLNTWKMVSLVYNGSTVKIYVDGTEIQSTAHTTNPNTTQNRRLFLTHDALVGYERLDLVSFFNIAKTAGEITTLYNGGSGIEL